MVAIGSVDVRNPNPDGTISLDVPGLANVSKGGNWHANYLFQAADIIPYGNSAPKAENFNSYTWELDITEYAFTAGNHLGVILFSTDPIFCYLTLPGDSTEFTVNIGPGTYLSLPIIMPTVDFLGSDGDTVLATQSIFMREFINKAAVPTLDQKGAKILGWIDVETGGSFDFNTAITKSYRLMPKEVLANVLVSASVKKIPGNKNDLTITLTEVYTGGTKIVSTKTFSIDNNAAGYYDVGGYKVYVDTKGNDQIRACYVV
jgi:hypothetical protein